MIDRESIDAKLVSFDRRARVKFSNCDRKRGAFATETDALTQRPACPWRPPQAQWFRPPLQLKGPQESRQPEDVVAMHVRKEEIAERKSDPVPHHLPLCSLAAIEKKCLSFPNDGEGADATFNGGAGSGSTEKANE